MYVEFSNDATEIVKNLKLLLDLCLVDHENVAIKYKHIKIRADNKCNSEDLHITLATADTNVCNDTNTQEGVFETSTLSGEYRFVTHDKYGFAHWLRVKQNLDEETRKKYVFEVRAAEKFAEFLRLPSQKLYTDNTKEALNTANILLRNSQFTIYDSRRNNIASTAIKLYLAYVGVANTAQTINSRQNKSDESDYSEIYEPLRRVLSERFSNGFRVDSPIELERFRSFSEDRLPTTLLENGEELRAAIIGCSTIFDGKAYAVSDDTATQIHTKVEEYFSGGAHAVFYSEFFKLSMIYFVSCCVFLFCGVCYRQNAL